MWHLRKKLEIKIKIVLERDVGRDLSRQLGFRNRILERSSAWPFLLRKSLLRHENGGVWDAWRPTLRNFVQPLSRLEG
jgi:hypothetical protein